MQAEVPMLDPRPALSMMDMGMGHDMSRMSGTNGMGDMEGMDHADMDHSSMPGMDMSAMQSSETGQMNHAGMDHAAHGANAKSDQLQHPTSESSPIVDQQIMQANTSLADPGIGLRNNGRRVLTYADLHTIGGPIDRREPGREIELHLTGHMERFIWSFNGSKFSEAEPLRFNHGERLRITLVNDSMMSHPIHLHGMWSEVVAPNGEFQVRKHTVNVNPAQKISYDVTADALGRWAYHCHLLYHMEAGMFREVHVEHEGGHMEERT
jgi:CopA family copper-resistance protein